jgi:hypothetical protein
MQVGMACRFHMAGTFQNSGNLLGHASCSKQISQRCKWMLKVRHAYIGHGKSSGEVAFRESQGNYRKSGREV